MEKILIYYDSAASGDFQRSVETALKRCNALIENFESFQSWLKIKTFEDWFDLVSDPVKMFDDTLLQNVNMQATGGKKPGAEVVAQIFDINRDDYLEAIDKTITKADYEFYSEYLSFNGGNFVLNNDVIKSHLESFKTYATNERQIAIVNHWQELCKILNEHQALGYVGTTAIEQAGKLLGLRFVAGQGKLYLNEQSIVGEILKAK